MGQNHGQWNSVPNKSLERTRNRAAQACRSTARTTASSAAWSRSSGLVLITCTANDVAVGLAYPLASLIAGQNASAIGDANDPLGGIGCNGAQHTPETSAAKLGAVGSAYSFEAGKLYNLNADAVIMDHSDIRKAEVVYAMLRAAATT